MGRACLRCVPSVRAWASASSKLRGLPIQMPIAAGMEQRSVGRRGELVDDRSRASSDRSQENFFRERPGDMRDGEIIVFRICLESSREYLVSRHTKEGNELKHKGGSKKLLSWSVWKILLTAL